MCEISLYVTAECRIRKGKKSVQMTLSREGRPSGEAYIEMETPEDVELACKRDRDYMGHRYIEGNLLILCIILYAILMLHKGIFYISVKFKTGLLFCDITIL